MIPDIKFCGLMRREDAAAAAAAGARYGGVIFAGGPRTLTLAEARLVLDGLGDGDPAGGPSRVGVFGADAPERIAEMAIGAALDVVQLHGDPSVDVVQRLRRAFGGRVWAVVRVDPDGRVNVPRGLVEAVDAVLLDTRVAGKLGGTGEGFDWAAAAPRLQPLRRQTALVLAGGLTPENVARAIAIVAPAVVDVSSGVERAPGVKDHDRMRAFADAVAGCEVRA